MDDIRACSTESEMSKCTDGFSFMCKHFHCTEFDQWSWQRNNNNDNNNNSLNTSNLKNVVFQTDHGSKNVGRSHLQLHWLAWSNEVCPVGIHWQGHVPTIVLATLDNWLVSEEGIQTMLHKT